MMQGIDRDFDAAVFVGYHAKMGEVGVLSHTISGSGDVWVNDIPGETGITPVWLGILESRLSLSQAMTLSPRKPRPSAPRTHCHRKWAVTRTAARCLPPEKARETIEEETFRRGAL